MIPADLLVSAYSTGWFPMAGQDGEIRWHSPDPRGILPFDRFHVSSRLARVIRQGRFEVQIDRDFRGVIDACANREDDDASWIDVEIADSYCALHEQGLAHSVETWRGGRLVGGLYGVALGGAFFGESMFHHETDASKVALVALVDRLRARGYALVDIQWATDHLTQFGAIEIPRRRYLRMLNQALLVEATFTGG